MIITETKSIQAILSNHDFIKYVQMRGDFVKIIGRGLSHAEGNTHKRQRKMMNPAFTHSNIKVCIYI